MVRRTTKAALTLAAMVSVAAAVTLVAAPAGVAAVSYTHLTLPTILLV